MNYIEEFRHYADTCRRDPAFMMPIENAFRKSGLGEILGWTPPPKTVEGPPPPFPAIGEITAVQTSLFDNWPMARPVKGVPSRYGLAIEVWTLPPDRIVVAKGKKPNFQFKSQSALMDSANLQRQVADLRRKKRRAPLDPDYLDALAQMAEAVRDTNIYVGMINTNIIDDRSGYERGRYYHSFQFVLVEVKDGKVEWAKLALNDDEMDLPPFAERDAGGNPLARNVVAQSRHDRYSMIQSSWSTDEE